jgi:uncharacterized protein (DUF1778 family)
LDAARFAAEEALLDQVLLSAGRASYVQFLARLDMPANPSRRLIRTMKTKAPWDKA